MQSDAPDVDAYLEAVPAERKAALTALRELCREVLSGYGESMQYKMPSYARDGAIAVSFASQKGYISLYVMTEALEAERANLAHLNVGKSCIRFHKPEQMDWAVIRRMLEATRDAAAPAS